MSKYIFQLGNTPELSIRELTAVLPGAEFNQPLSEVAIADLSSDTEAMELMGRLGGTIKIIKVLSELSQTAPDSLRSEIVKLLKNENRIDFAIAELGRDHLPPIDPSDIKNDLQELGMKARFREGSRHGLSAAVILNTKRLREIYLVQTTKVVYLGETLIAQDIDDWSKRDRQKPYADRKKGMLPPKVARMMVNLAISNSNANDKNLLDPFCGSGTVLMEAALFGLSVFGSDQDPDSIEGTRKNLTWLSQQYQAEINQWLSVQDATRLQLPANTKIDFLVTEPFLGKPRPNPAKLPFIFKGLERLYLGAFRQWTHFLKERAQIVIVFPYVEAEISGRKQAFSLDKLIDKLSELGYTTNSEPVIYSRSGAVVQRQIYQFTYQSK